MKHDGDTTQPHVGIKEDRLIVSACLAMNILGLSQLLSSDVTTDLQNLVALLLVSSLPFLGVNALVQLNRSSGRLIPSSWYGDIALGMSMFLTIVAFAILLSQINVAVSVVFAICCILAIWLYITLQLKYENHVLGGDGNTTIYSFFGFGHSKPKTSESEKTQAE